MRNDARRTERCALKHEEASVDHCFEWTLKEARRPDNTRSKIIFAVKDCTGGFLLPGEFQHSIFGNSFSPSTLIEDHIKRFGFLGPPPTYLGPKPIDDAWTVKDHNFVMQAKNKVIGPADGNLEICGRGGYCVRHKLTDRNCCMSECSHVLQAIPLTTSSPRYLQAWVRRQQVGPHCLGQGDARDLLRAFQPSRVPWPAAGHQGRHP